MGNELFTTTFWKEAGNRALKTCAQTAVALIGTGAAGILDVEWIGVVSGAALAAVLSILTSIGSDQLSGERGRGAKA